MITNALKCFNEALKQARELQIQALITLIYYNLFIKFIKSVKATIRPKESNMSSFTQMIQSVLTRYE